VLIITGTFRVPVDAIERARPAMTAMLLASRAEEGCLLYAYSQDVLDSGLFHVNERWTDAETLQAHSRTTHMAAWRSVWAELGIGERNLRLYETDEGRAF
jgi:quinol monooxygenase YgiN